MAMRNTCIAVLLVTVLSSCDRADQRICLCINEEVDGGYPSRTDESMARLWRTGVFASNCLKGEDSLFELFEKNTACCGADSLNLYHLRPNRSFTMYQRSDGGYRALTTGLTWRSSTIEDAGACIGSDVQPRLLEVFHQDGGLYLSAAVSCTDERSIGVGPRGGTAYQSKEILPNNWTPARCTGLQERDASE